MNAKLAKLEALLSLVRERAAEERNVIALVAPLQVAAPSSDELGTSAGIDLDPPELDEPTTFTDEGETLSTEGSHQPESGQIANASLDQAINSAEHQAPLTPPPESGEEIARPQLPRDKGPTMEQLGQTIHLDEGGPENLELDEPDLETETEFLKESRRAAELKAARPRGHISSIPASENLEANIRSSLPSEAPLRVPENAREELERLALGEPVPIEARISKRPAMNTNTLELVTASREFKPATFLELLDASLSLKSG